MLRSTYPVRTRNPAWHLCVHYERHKAQTIVALTRRAVQPWLRADVIREPSGGASSCKINDEVKLCHANASHISARTISDKSERTLIEWCSSTTPIYGRPWVLHDDILARSHVHCDAWELSHVPKVGICTLGGYSVEIDHGLESIVDVEAHPRIGPFHRIDVEGGGIRRALGGDPAVYAVH